MSTHSMTIPPGVTASVSKRGFALSWIERALLPNVRDVLKTTPQHFPTGKLLASVCFNDQGGYSGEFTIITGETTEWVDRVLDLKAQCNAFFSRDTLQAEQFKGGVRRTLEELKPHTHFTLDTDSVHYESWGFRFSLAPDFRFSDFDYGYRSDDEREWDMAAEVLYDMDKTYVLADFTLEDDGSLRAEVFLPD